MARLDGKVVLLTGADGGIGGPLSRAIYAEGACLMLHGLDAEALRATAREAGWDEDRYIVHAHDVRDGTATQAAVSQGISRFGRIDALINLAGINRFGGILRCSEEEWDAVMAINVKGYFLTTRAVVPHMKTAGSGTIVNMSSIWGVRGNSRMMAYSTSKHAVEGFTKSLRAEVASWGIKVSSLIVGIVDNSFRDAMRDHVAFTDDECERMLRSEDIVEPVIYMLETPPQALASSITLEAWLLQ
ncbi:MAG: SDR family oxidoreductase [Magnetospirillum sp.]|nr:SDR family oxidoreductase [Magnetospirillum sp.]